MKEKTVSWGACQTHNFELERQIDFAENFDKIRVGRYGGVTSGFQNFYKNGKYTGGEVIVGDIQWGLWSRINPDISLSGVFFSASDLNFA